MADLDQLQRLDDQIRAAEHHVVRMLADALSEPAHRVGPDGVECATVGQLWQEARDAAESRGALDPRACADRYLQGRELAAKIAGGA